MIKKLIISSIIVVSVILFLNFFGETILIKFFDKFQNKICLSKTCINKPKGWIPAYIKRNNQLYILGFINSKYLPTSINIDEFRNNEVELIKGFDSNSSITIAEYLQIDKNLLDKMDIYRYNNKKYFYLKKKFGVIVIDTNNHVVLMMEQLNKQIIDRILNSNMIRSEYMYF